MVILAISAVLFGKCAGSAPAEPARPALAPGLIGRYFGQPLGEKPACVRIDPGVAFD